MRREEKRIKKKNNARKILPAHNKLLKDSNENTQLDTINEF